MKSGAKWAIGLGSGCLVVVVIVLVIHPNGVVKGNLEVDAQTLKRRGKVLGTVTGEYQVFED